MSRGLALSGSLGERCDYSYRHWEAGMRTAGPSGLRDNKSTP